MSKFKVIIIDDEPLARSVVMEYLLKHSEFEVLAECGNGYEGIKAITKHHPDLIFLDIQMPKINGFEMLEVLDNKPAAIFTTAFDEYAIKAFEANAVDYLLKPFSQERFNQALLKWKDKSIDVNNKNVDLASDQYTALDFNKVVIRNGGDISIVPVVDIVYIEAYDDYVKLFTKDSYYLKKKTMQFFEDTLDPKQFFRTHRSYIINIQELTKIEPLEKNTYIAILRNGKKIPLSRPAYINMKEKLGI